MSEFNLKLALKDKEDITNYKNIYSIKATQFEKFSGKIVYTNYEYPDQYIFRAYFVKGKTGYPLSFNLKDSPSKIIPNFSLQELDYEDIIIFYKTEDIKP